MKKLLLSAFAIIALSAISFGQSLVSASAQANVAQGFSIANGTTLNFGSFAVIAAGSITQDEIGGAPTGTGFQPLGGNLEGSFIITGPASKAFQITMPTADVKLKRQTGTEQMNIPFTSWVTSLSATLNGSTNGLGAASFTVGATLEFANAQVAGQYTGTYDVTVAYD